MTTKRIAFEKCAFIEFAFVKTMNSGVYKSDLICIRCIGNVHNKEWIARRRRRQKRLLLCNLERKQNITRLYWHLCELCSLLFPYESSLSRTRHWCIKDQSLMHHDASPDSSDCQRQLIPMNHIHFDPCETRIPSNLFHQLESKFGFPFLKMFYKKHFR